MNLVAVVLFAQLATATPPPVTSIADARPTPGNPNVLVSRVPDAPPEVRARVRQYLNARAAALLDVAPDGKQILIATRFANTNQLHVVSQPLGAREQVTFLDEPVNQARFSPLDPSAIYYLSDIGGGEFYQVFALDRKTGRSTLLTDGKSRHESLHVAATGTRLAWSGTDRNGKDVDVYVADSAAPTHPRLLVEADGEYQPVDFSRDGAKLLVVHNRAIDDADLWLVDADSGDKKMLTPDAKTNGKAGVRNAVFAPDGKSVWYVTDRFGEFAELYRLDLTKPDAVPVPISRGIPWDVENVAAAPDGSGVVFSVNEAGLSKLYWWNVKTRKAVLVTTPAGIIGRIQFPLRSSDSIFLTLSNARSPSDVYQLSLKTKKLLQWTRSEVGGLDAKNFPMPTLERYPTTDGLTISAFVYKPEKHEGKLPVILLWHGGPEAQYRPYFSTFTALMTAELGAAVVAPNVRGSDGYGKQFLALDDGVKRERSLADIGATLDWIAKQPDLDPARVGVYGGSYGGYMTLATAAFYAARIKAACDVVGISSLPTFLEHTQAYRRDLRRVEYGDERVPEVLAVQKRISPLYSVDKILAAMFVQQGKNDPRVPQSEAEQIVTALRKRGKDAWYLLALDEGHGFQKKENRDLAILDTFLFFSQKLK